MDHEVHHPVAVAKFIVVPGNELDKVVIEGNDSPSIEGRGGGLSEPGWPPTPAASQTFVSPAQAFRDPDLCIIHFAFGAQSTRSQICGQMDGHSYANSLVLVAKCTWKSHFPQLPLRHFKYSKPGEFFHFH